MQNVSSLQFNLQLASVKLATHNPPAEKLIPANINNIFETDALNFFLLRSMRYDTVHIVYTKSVAGANVPTIQF